MLSTHLRDSYEYYRKSMSPFPDADADFMALASAYTSLSTDDKLAMMMQLSEQWRQRCIQAEALLTEEQLSAHLSRYFAKIPLK